jgi:hypothetical protein
VESKIRDGSPKEGSSSERETLEDAERTKRAISNVYR